MNKKIIEEILNTLNKNIEEKGEYIQFNDPSYKPIKISKDNFHEIKDTNETTKIAFIDGGNTEILKAPNFSLQLIRIYYTIYQNNKLLNSKNSKGLEKPKVFQKRINSKKQEFYILINAINQENNIIYKTKFFGLEKEEIDFNSFDESLRQGNHRISISQIGNAIRRFLELETAKNITEELQNKDIILIDGDLKASITDETEYLDQLYQKAIKKNITIAAISKTSELFTEKGNAIIPVLNEIAPNNEWYYHPLVEINNPAHKADLLITKLHKSSRYVFKLEIFKETNKDTNQILSTIKNNSKDPVFLGYPYGLIEADQFARVTNNEKDYIKTMFLTKVGKDNKKIAHYLNTLNTHNILDSISY